MSRLLRCALICGICAGFGPHYDNPEGSMGRSKSTKARKSTKHNAFELSLAEIKRYHLRSAMHAIVASGALKECYKDYQSRRNDCLAVDKEDVPKVVAFFDDIKKHGERQDEIDSVAWNEFAKIHTLFLRYALPAGSEESHEYRMSLGDSAAIMAKALLEFWRIEAGKNERLAFDKSYEYIGLKIAQYVFKNHSILQERLRRSVERVQHCPEYANVAAIEVLCDYFSELESSAKDKAEEFVVPDIMQEITEEVHGSIQSIPIEEARLLVGLTQESQTLARELSKVRAGASENYNEYCREMQAIHHQWFMTMLIGSKSELSEITKAKLADIAKYVRENDQGTDMSPMLPIKRKDFAEYLGIGKLVCEYVRGQPYLADSLIYMNNTVRQETPERIAALFLETVRWYAKDHGAQSLETAPGSAKGDVYDERSEKLVRKLDKLKEISDGQYFSEAKLIRLGWFRELLAQPLDLGDFEAGDFHDLSVEVDRQNPTHNIEPFEIEGPTPAQVRSPEQSVKKMRPADSAGSKKGMGPSETDRLRGEALLALREEMESGPSTRTFEKNGESKGWRFCYASALVLSAFPWAYTGTVLLRTLLGGSPEVEVQHPLSPAPNACPAVNITDILDRECPGAHLPCCRDVTNGMLYSMYNLHEIGWFDKGAVTDPSCIALLTRDAEVPMLYIFCAHDQEGWGELSKAWPENPEDVSVLNKLGIGIAQTPKWEMSPVAEQCRINGCLQSSEIECIEVATSEPQFKVMNQALASAQVNELRKIFAIAPKYTSLSAVKAVTKLRALIDRSTSKVVGSELRSITGIPSLEVHV